MTRAPRRAILAPLEREIGRVKQPWLVLLLSVVFCGVVSADTEIVKYMTVWFREYELELERAGDR